MYDRIMIKYGELSIKGKNKINFIDHIFSTIKSKCQHLKNLEYVRHHDRLYILLNGENSTNVIECLNKVFGLHSYNLCARCDNDLDEIKKLSLQIISNEIKNFTTFKVETNRAFKPFPINSMEVSKEVSRFVLRNSPQLKVDVNHPLVTLNIDIRSDGTYIMLNEINGLGGLPVGMDGKGLLMISGGIDSPVAGFLALKRGVAIEAIHFASPPFTSDLAKQKVIELIEKLTKYMPNSKIKIHIVPFTNLQKAIYENCPESYGITIMRRMMYRISEIIAKRNKALIIINGENIGQVASQTLNSLYVVNEVTTMPVIRPLVTMDKNEIIKIGRKIDTYDISIKPYEDCCTIFIPKNPVTKPDLQKVYNFESKFDFQTLIAECVDNIEEIIVSEGQKNIDNFIDLF